MYTLKWCAPILVACACNAQVTRFPFVQNFDTVAVPDLPPGWITTTNNPSSNGFTTTASSVHSPPNAVVSTNSSVEQSIMSPLLDFTDREADSLVFFERRSSSHNSGLLIEASTDGGVTFPIELGDTIKNPGTTSYVQRGLKLPQSIDNQRAVRLRWHVTGNGTGKSGTIRFDDVCITVITSRDAGVASVSFLPSHPVISDSVMIQATIKNLGIRTIENITVEFFRDSNGDSLPQPSELIAARTLQQQLQPNDSVVVGSEIGDLAFGQQVFLVKVIAQNDENSKNDLLRAILFVGLPVRSVVINEIMYQPMPGSSEYVELYNRLSESVNMRGWTVSDMPDKNGHANEFLISNKPLVLKPCEYIVVAADSTIFNSFPYLIDTSFRSVELGKSGLSLNDGGDDVTLRDLTGQEIDSVHYDPSWHNANLSDVTGRSLERINPILPSNDPKNWSTCSYPLGGTPGKQNSIYTVSVPASTSLTISPNPFSPDGDGHEDFTMISYELPTTAALVRIRIFDGKGRLIRTLANGEPSGAHGQIIWDGFSDDRNKARIGIYIVLIEALDGNGSAVQAMKGVVVVAAKL